MKKLFILFLFFINNIYSQCSGTTTWNGASWSNGLPSITKSAIISGYYDTGINGSLDCCSLIISDLSSLIIEIGDYCNVNGNITINPLGTLLVKSGGSLIPVNNACISTGIVRVERRTPSTKRYDYTYWSSPVTTNIGNALLPTNWETTYTFSFITSNFLDVETSYFGTFISSNPDGQDDNNDAWNETTLTTPMIAGKGYASMIKSLVSTGTYPRTELVTFEGSLNTGTIQIPLELSLNSSSSVDDFNLVGNPYSSAINSNDLIDTNINNISGTLYFWTHSNTLNSSYTGLAMYNFSTNDYAKYTKLGGISAVFGGKQPSNVIGSGQGFLVEAENSANLIFHPSMMSKAYSNTTSVSFFRSRSRENKLWISMKTLDNFLFSQQLIGYNNNTSLELNKGWDSNIVIINQALKFYSLESGNKYDIQARGEYNKFDVIKLGYFSALAGTYVIELDSLENINKVYLFDKYLSRVHKLTTPYYFESNSGTFDNRFELRFKKGSSEVESIEVKIYNFSGNLIKTIKLNNIEDLDTSQLSKGLYILKIFDEDEIITKKIII